MQIPYFGLQGLDAWSLPPSNLCHFLPSSLCCNHTVPSYYPNTPISFQPQEFCSCWSHYLESSFPGS